MKPILGWAWFLCVQVLAFYMFLAGLLPVAIFSALEAYHLRMSHEFPNRLIEAWNCEWLMYAYDNEEDGVLGPVSFNPNAGRWRAFVWSALRNPANNLRFTFAWKGGPWFHYVAKSWYFQAGFRPDTGWPVLSAGRGTGTVVVK